MERLAICSKLFYDRDVIEKHKKILELEKQVENLKNELKEPKASSIREINGISSNK